METTVKNVHPVTPLEETNYLEGKNLCKGRRADRQALGTGG